MRLSVLLVIAIPIAIPIALGAAPVAHADEPIPLYALVDAAAQSYCG